MTGEDILNKCKSNFKSDLSDINDGFVLKACNSIIDDERTILSYFC